MPAIFPSVVTAVLALTVCSGCSMMRGSAPQPTFSGANMPRAMAPLPQKLGYMPAMVNPNRHVDFMPDVPLYPTAYAITMPTGSVGNVYSRHASYFAPLINMPQAVQFYHQAMAKNGWQKHPDADIYRKGHAQMALHLKPTSTGVLVEYATGRQILHDGSWEYALHRERMRGGGI